MNLTAFLSALGGLGAIAAATLVLSRSRASVDVARFVQPLAGRLAPVIIGVVTSLLTWWLWGTLNATPYVHDEVALLLQARIFASFHWAAPSPSLPEFFEQFQVFVTPTLAPKYPPGHALLMVPGVWLRVPGLVSIMLSGVTGGMLFALARRFSNGVVALVAWIVWLTAPAALRFRPSYFSEITTGAIWLVGWWTLIRYRETGARRWLVALTALVAWGGITRPLPMIAFAIPAGLVALWTVWQRHAWGDAVASLPLALAICAIVPLWGHAVLGEWDKNPYAFYQTMYFPEENPGFGIDSTPPLRALPPDMEKFHEYARPMHSVHTADRIVSVLKDRMLAVRNGTWGDRSFLILLAVVGLLVMPPPMVVACVTCGLTMLGYLWIAHNPTWVVYYLELLPVLAFLSALGLWQFVTLVAELPPARVGRARQLTFPGLAVAMGVVGWVTYDSVQPLSRWREAHAAAPRYRESFNRLVARIPERKVVVFVRYAPNADVHQSLTNNEPDPRTARVWAVHDLGDQNLRLLQAAPDRAPYLYEELPHRRVLRPFPIPDEWRSKLPMRSHHDRSTSIEILNDSAAR